MALTSSVYIAWLCMQGLWSIQ